MRCLIVVPSLGRGGAERQAVLLGLVLRDQGLDVKLFVQAGPDALARDGLTGPLPVDISLASVSAPAQLVRLRAAVEAFAPDAVITFLRGATARFALTRATSAVARRAAWIITARGNIQLKHFAESPVVFAAQLRWHREAERICANSAALAANLFTLDASVASRLAVLPNILLPFDVDIAGARARVEKLVGGAEHRPVIGSLGSFQEDRNYPLLAEALPFVLRARPQAHLLLIGRSTGPLYSSGADEFLARVEALGLRDHVTVAGEIANGRALLPGFDVFALPSKLEGASNALAEAMIAGIATATTPVGDAQERVADAAVVSAGWTPSAFGAALVAAIENAPALRERAAERGRVLIDEQSPGRMGPRWMALIGEAVEAAGKRQGNGSLRSRG